MKAIAAMSTNRAIGKNGALPWPSIKEDFKWFKEFTMNNVIVVGRTTYSTLPPLPGRNIIVLSNTMKEILPPTVLQRSNIEELIKCADDVSFHHSKETIVAGGAKTYESLLPYIKEFYITHVNGEYSGDTFMPLFEHLFDKTETVREFTNGHKVIKYSKTV